MSQHDEPHNATAVRERLENERQRNAAIETVRKGLSARRHPAEMELDEIETLLDAHMGPRWRGYRGPADALGVLLHEMKDAARGSV